MKFYEKFEEMMRYYSTSGGFLTVKNGSGVNTMTVAWGFVGFVWNKPYFIALVRKTRHTYDLMKDADSFTVSVPFGTMSEELKICGTKSGREIDKSQIVKFLPAKSVESPIVHGCDRYYECKIRYIDGMDGDKIPQDVKKVMYKDDYHEIFWGEIVENY